MLSSGCRNEVQCLPKYAELPPECGDHHGHHQWLAAVCLCGGSLHQQPPPDGRGLRAVWDVPQSAVRTTQLARNLLQVMLNTVYLILHLVILIVFFMHRSKKFFQGGWVHR